MVHSVIRFGGAFSSLGSVLLAIAPALGEDLVRSQSGLETVPTVSELAIEPKPQGGMGQVTSVSQLSDVRPTDWAFQALQSLVERYGCIVGYPDKTYRGNRPLSRYEFAAGLNACLDKIQELIAAATADFVKKEDLETVKKLQEEFAAELAALRGRIETLEVRTATLEKQQFSTTTRLGGEVVLGAVGFIAGESATGSDIFNSAYVGDRVRLNFDTSFTGEDLLRTRPTSPLGSSPRAPLKAICAMPGVKITQSKSMRCCISSRWATNSPS